MARTEATYLLMKSRYDVVILGAGHNGLVVSSYLGRAGLSVLLLEKNDYIGGATTGRWCAWSRAGADRDSTRDRE
jgi:ribulose 1,5-bisphosphate synthetase/thiazole synthase